ncbi:DUF2304 domain-containing protein [Flaviflexus equikiangi]|uniref:DUF2304 domain-containing protein n=1 Tax=Flaviflexus equikiangi TaxID=2758573 RepID=A0ABS2TGX1_9ACTO|nr:DUF2304 domain-containing protein [Flaviflexus equikiangi]MBM9433899.1 DUF2304 domain-containing protein [Flaviflexus equikiangi]
MLIQVVLIATVLVCAYYLVRSTARDKNVALRRLLLALFVVVGIVSIIFPQITTTVAQFVGVGRGTDLLLYMLIISFLSYSVVSFRKMTAMENRITDLAREVALATSDPARKQHDPGTEA